MTYCVGMLLEEGLVMVADSRTNAGVDHISTFAKMSRWEVPGERVLVMMTAGNLAVTQAVVNMVSEGVGEEEETLLTVPGMFAAARLVGRSLRGVWREDGEAMEAQGADFNAAIILGGQVQGRPLRLFQIYAAGNFIEATADTPYFQIGEAKYGKPILDRGLTATSSLTEGVKLALVSMDSTLRSNISVGLPIDLVVYERDALAITQNRRIEEGDPYFTRISERWSRALRTAFSRLPDPEW